MKQLLYFFTISLILFGLASCNINKPLASDKAQNNKTYTVDYLFEQDGCKVYRFNDDGRYVYFTNCTGEVSTAKTDSTKTQVQTIVKRR